MKNIYIRNVVRGKATDNSPTLDRIDNTKGYVRGNIIVASKRANTIKNCGSPEEHNRIYEYYSTLSHTIVSSD